jgi:uncharacterized protein
LEPEDVLFLLHGDTVELTLPMPIRRVGSYDLVADNVGKVAIERGPIVYWAEAIDNGSHALHLTISDTETLESVQVPDLLGGITASLLCLVA